MPEQKKRHRPGEDEQEQDRRDPRRPPDQEDLEDIFKDKSPDEYIDEEKENSEKQERSKE